MPSQKATHSIASIDTLDCGLSQFYETGENKDYSTARQELNPLYQQLLSWQISVLFNGSTIQDWGTDSGPHYWLERYQALAQALNDSFSNTRQGSAEEAVNHCKAHLLSIADLERGEPAGTTLMPLNGSRSSRKELSWTTWQKLSNDRIQAKKLKAPVDPITLTYAQMHQAALDSEQNDAPAKNISFNFITSDRNKAYKLIKFYSAHPEAIPNNIGLNIHIHDPKSNEVSTRIAKIAGAGLVNQDLSQTVKKLYAIDTAFSEGPSNSIKNCKRLSRLQPERLQAMEINTPSDEAKQSNFDPQTLRQKLDKEESVLSEIIEKNSGFYTQLFPKKDFNPSTKDFAKKQKLIILKHEMCKLEISIAEAALSEGVDKADIKNLSSLYLRQALELIKKSKEENSALFKKHRNYYTDMALMPLDLTKRLLLGIITPLRLAGDLAHGNPIEGIKYIPLLSIFSRNGNCGQTQTMKDINRAENRLLMLAQKKASP